MRKTRIGKLLAAALVTAALAAFGTTAWADTWNGQTPSERPDGYVADDSKKTVTISDAAGLAWLSKVVAGTPQEANAEASTQPVWAVKPNNLAGYTVTLTKDIDLDNKPWTPIGQSWYSLSGV